MKIAFVAAANSPHTIKWVNAMVKKKHEVAVFSLPDHKDEQGEISDKATVTYLPLYAVQKGFAKNAAGLRQLIEAGGFDAVNAIGASTYGFMAAKAKLPNLLLTLSGLDVYYDVTLGKKGAVKKALKHAQAVCAAAANMQTRIAELFKMHKQFFVAPFGVDLKKFIKKDVEKEGVCFGSTKMLESVNGVDLVIKAFANFKKDYDGKAALKIAGTGTEEPALKTLAQSLGVADDVEFLGYVPNKDVPALLNQVDVLLQMSHYESFGVGAVEAMACEVPVIASDTIGASEYILNGVTGYLVKSGNISACADRMRDLVRDEAGRARMGQKARTDVEELYSIDKCADKYEAALEAVK